MTKLVSCIHDDDIDDISLTSKGSASGDDDSFDDYDNSNNNSDEEEDEDDTNNVDIDNEIDIDKDDDEDYAEIDKDDVNDEDFSSKIVFGSNIKNIKDLGSDDNLSESENEDGTYDTDYDDKDPSYVETSMRQHMIDSKRKNVTIDASDSSSSDSDEEDGNINSDEEDGNINSEKISDSMRENILNKYHPESNIISKDELYSLCVVRRDTNNVIVDENHRTIPILTKYEKTKILGLRAKQINNGAVPLVEIGDLPTNLHESTVQQLQNKHYDGYLIALEELKQKKIPVIIRRPFPNGKSEYWPLRELEVFM